MNAASIFRSALTMISPKLNTKVCYRVKFGRKLDLNHPVTLNEKNLWLKFNTYWNNPTVKQCADKLRVRDYLTQQGLGYLLNDLIGVYYDVDDIKWEELPHRFALKLNVGCGCNIIVSDKSRLDIEAAKKTMRKWLKSNYWLGWSEMQYKGVKPCILIEKYLGDPEKEALPTDYKVYCFNGEPLYILVCVGRENKGHPKFYFFNHNWELARINKDSIAAPEGFSLEKPSCLEEMLNTAKQLSEPFPFIRCDFFVVDSRLIFGEMTFTPAGAMDTNRLPETDLMFGNLLKLPRK